MQKIHLETTISCYSTSEFLSFLHQKYLDFYYEEQDPFIEGSLKDYVNSLGA